MCQRVCVCVLVHEWAIEIVANVAKVFEGSCYIMPMCPVRWWLVDGGLPGG